MPLLICLLLSYLVGSIPFGYLAGKLIGGVDIRRVGSGNIGATNVGRVLGWHWFGVVLVLDFLKGFGPTFGSSFLQPSLTTIWPTPVEFTLLCGISAIMGHLWPIYLRFQGGKGVATGLGVILALAPLVGWWPPLAALLTFLTCLLIWRYISLGSVAASLSYSITQLITLPNGPLMSNWGIILFSLVLPGLVIWRHRTNMARIVRGEETKVGQRVSAVPSSSSSPNTNST